MPHKMAAWISQIAPARRSQASEASAGIPSAMEDYGHKLDEHDASRYSHESSISLLHGYSHQSDSTPECSALPEQGRSKVLHSQSGLLQSVTEGRRQREDSELQYGDTIFGQSRRESGDAASGTGNTRGPPAVFSRWFSLPRPAHLMVIRVISYTVANRGLFMIAASQAAFASMNALVKVMTSSEVAVPIWELIFTRMSITWLLCYLYMRATGVEDPLLGPEAMRGKLLVRGFVGFCSLFCRYYSVKYLSLSDATVLGFLSPTVTGVLATLVLGEPYSPKEAIAGFISLGGAILVAQPSFLFPQITHDTDPHQRLLAVAVALVGVGFASAAYILIRQIGKTAHALHSVAYLCTGCVFASLLMPILIRDETVVLPKEPIFWAYLAGIGISGFLAQFLLAKALQIERVGRALLGNYTELPWALLLQYFIFGEVMGILSSFGSLIIMGSTCWVVLTRKQEGEETKSTSITHRNTDDLGSTIRLQRGGSQDRQLSSDPREQYSILAESGHAKYARLVVDEERYQVETSLAAHASLAGGLPSTLPDSKAP